MSPSNKPLSSQASSDLEILLRDLVHQETGIFFDEKWLAIFVEKIAPLAEARGVAMLEYFYILKYDKQSDEWSNVFNALSVLETYFWREVLQVKALISDVVPTWFGRGKGPLRIWSAACATGEEALTIAIALEEAGWGKHPIEIVASDASLNALTKAKTGIYRERAFRVLPPALKEKYFSATAKGWQIDPALLKRISFRRANLVAPSEIAELSASPVIFCRNVFIYFSRESIRRTLGSFARGMPKNGHLFVGLSESLVNLTDDFSLEEIAGAFVYLRKPRNNS